MARFFEYPINYIGNRTYSTATPAVYLPAAQDNNFSTSTGETTIDVFIDTVGDGSGDAQAWTSLFVKCKGIASYDVAVTDGNIVSLNVTIPTNLTLYNTPVTDLRGFQNHLYFFSGTTPAVPSGKVLRFTITAITGQTPAIYEIMVMNEVLAIDEGETRADRPRFSNIEYTHVERGSVIQEDIEGGLSKAPPLNNTRSKYRVNYTTRYKNRQDLERMLNFKEDYDAFGFAPNYELYPQLVFPAVFTNTETPIRYANPWTLGPRTLELTIDEK